ncbi:MAG TPA: DUF4424 domain-containing protein [Rickettsia endosymbiont of Omalisus fontisbellaquei]|nr:DUF4424 domain-containing protein [Rickettsia endosymbiont of Omalisus fontisbellaquei]
MHIFILSLLTKFCLFFSFVVSANDTTVTISNNAVIYTKSNDISMDLEILKISTKKIEIEYQFTNHSNNDITTQVIFPLPLSPVTSEEGLCSHYLYYLTELYQSYLLNVKTFDYSPTDFKRTVNGEEYNYGIIVRAIDKDGKDITNILIDNNIPLLSSTYIAGCWDSEVINNQLKEKLTKLNLIDDQDRILWQLQMSYVWEQTFPAKQTINITHSYSPHVGNDFLNAFLDFDDNLTNYCVSTTDHELMLNKEPSTRVSEVHYILSTGANWKGPIKKFRLEITPPKAPHSIILGCIEIPFKKRDKGGVYIYEIENFTPKQDLKILFIGNDYKYIDIYSR